MKKIIILGITVALIGCTALETNNKVTLKDGTKVEVGVAIEQTTQSAIGGNE